MNHLEIKKQEKNKKYYIYINEDYYGFLYYSELKGLGIKLSHEQNKNVFEITDDVYSEIYKLVYRHAYTKAITYLTDTEYCEYDIRNKLKLKEHTDAIIDAVISELYIKKFLDNERYAESYARAYSSKKSKSLIKMELEKKRISLDNLDEIIDRVFEDEGISEDEMIKSILEKRFSGYDFSDDKCRNKVLSYFARRGFSIYKVNNYLT